MDVSNHILLPDKHIPAHNKPLMLAVLKYLYLNRDDIDSVSFIGDTMDMKAISFYDKGNIVDITLGVEYNIGCEILDLYDEAMGGHVDQVDFMYGNHEDRLNRSIMQLEIFKFGDALLDLNDGLKLHDRGYNVYTDWKEDELVFGDLHVIHGLYVNIHTAYQHALKLGKNMAFGHSHRVQSYNLGENRAKGYNIGWMGDKNHPYMKYMAKAQRDAWQNAFAKVTVVDGKHHLQIVEWRDDHFVLDGKIYK